MSSSKSIPRHPQSPNATARTASQRRPRQSHITRLLNGLFMRQARIRQMIERELSRDTPSALRLMRMKRLALTLNQRLDEFVMDAGRSVRTRRLVPVLARVH